LRARSSSTHPRMASRTQPAIAAGTLLITVVDAA
jgi:hypothetical protein